MFGNIRAKQVENMRQLNSGEFWVTYSKSGEQNSCKLPRARGLSLFQEKFMQDIKLLDGQMKNPQKFTGDERVERAKEFVAQHIGTSVADEADSTYRNNAVMRTIVLKSATVYPGLVVLVFGGGMEWVNKTTGIGRALSNFFGVVSPDKIMQQCLDNQMVVTAYLAACLGVVASPIADVIRARVHQRRFRRVINGDVGLKEKFEDYMKEKREEMKRKIDEIVGGRQGKFAEKS